MSEKLRFEGTPVVLLLVFGESFRAAMDVQKDLKIRIILIHITDARRGRPHTRGSFVHGYVLECSQ